MSDSSMTDINIRSARYFIARTVGTCPRCQSPMELLGMGVPAGHEALVPDEVPDDASVANQSIDVWSVVPYRAFLFHIDHIPQEIQHRLTSLAGSFRFARSGEVGTGWANHCGWCGLRLDDQELFCEPEGAFLPVSAESAQLIRLLRVDERFEAAAAGWAYEPQFFEAMTQERS